MTSAEPTTTTTTTTTNRDDATNGDTGLRKRREASSKPERGRPWSEPLEEALTTAYPPSHSVAVFAIVTLAAILSLPSLESIDEVAVKETFCTPLFPAALPSTLALACTRLFIASFMLTITAIIWTGPGIHDNSAYLPQSKLKAAKLTLTGWKSQAMFTTWSWNLLALSFTLNGFIPLLVELSGPSDVWFWNVHAQQWLMRAAIIGFEVAAPATLLVSGMIKYVLWPAAEARAEDGAQHLKEIKTLLQHNLNSILALVEIGLLGGAPVRPSDMSLSVLLAAAYVMFSWLMQHAWTNDDETTTTKRRTDPQFLYFVFDTTLGITTTLFLLGMLGVLMGSYAIFSSFHSVFGWLGGTTDAYRLPMHMGVVTLLSLSVCRLW